MQLSLASLVRTLLVALALAAAALPAVAAPPGQPAAQGQAVAPPKVETFQPLGNLPSNYRHLVPGAGMEIETVGDNFEDEKWEFYTNLPKSSEKIDGQQRYPAGVAKNDRWYEGMMRGTPDVVRRVPTPPGGLEGSKGSMLIKTLHSGIPGGTSYGAQQDDLIANVFDKLGGSIPVGQLPSCVARVYFPPFERWERRTGPTFAYRAACDTHATISDGPNEGLFGRETYWPGFFVEFEPKSGGYKQDGAYFRIRAGNGGGDMIGPRITQTGWWTLGMSFTPDGMIHFYGHPGLENLTVHDRMASFHSYGYRCERFKTFFFNVMSRDDGRTWSTDWVVDDCKVYFIKQDFARQPTKQPSR